MQQTFLAGSRLNEVKGTHKPLIHPPWGFCRKAEAFFCTRVPFPVTSTAEIVRNRTVSLNR
jgi:hypothetical protein